MRQKLAAVLRSYACRPWIVAGSLLYLFAVVIAALAALGSTGPHSVSSVFDTRHERIANFNHPSELVSWEADSSNAKFYKGIAIGRRTFQKPPTPNASSTEANSAKVSKTSFHEMDSKSLECLQRLTFLRKLELNAIQMTPELWQALAGLKELRALRIHVQGKVDLKELPILPKLELLSLGSVEPSELGVLRKQPSLRAIELADADFFESTENDDPIAQGAKLHEVVQLRELILNPRMRILEKTEIGYPANANSQGWEPWPISSSLCKEIQQLPNLRLVSIGERGAKPVSSIPDEGLVQAISASKKSIAIHSRLTETQFSFPYIDFMLSMLLLVIVVPQLQRHFSNSASLLIPNFTTPHLIIPGIAILGHVAMFTMIRTLVHGSHFIPAITASSFVLLGFCIANTMPTGRFVTPVLLIVMNPVLVFMTPTILDLFESPFWRFCQIGEYPVFSCSIVIAELVLLAMTLRHIANRPKALAAANRLDEPVPSNWVSELGKTTTAQSSKSGSMSLHRFLAHLQRDLKVPRIQLWNAGFETSPLGKFDWLWNLPVVFYIAFMSSDRIQNLNDLRGLTVYIPTGILVVGIYAVFMKTFVCVDRTLARKPLFEQETVLPLTKAMMRTIRMLALWVHVWPWLIVSFCCACIATLTKLVLPAWLQFPITSIWLFYFHCLFSVVGVWGLGLILLTIRLKADKWLISAPLAATWAIGSFALATHRWNGNGVGVHVLELLVILSPAVVGAFLVWMAWIRFPKTEWGDVSDH